MKEAKTKIERTYRTGRTKYVVLVEPRKIEVMVYTYPLHDHGQGNYYADSWTAYLPPRSRYAEVTKSRWNDGWATGREGSRYVSRITSPCFRDWVADIAEMLNELGDDDPALVGFAQDIVQSMGDDFVSEEDEDLVTRRS